MIKNAEFKEDIDMNKVQNINVFWEFMYEKNKIILGYFKNIKAGTSANLKENYISNINKIFLNLLKDKIEWNIFSKDIFIKIQKEINRKYYELFKK